MLNIVMTLLQVRIKSIWIEGKRGDFHTVILCNSKHMLSIAVILNNLFTVDVGYTGITSFSFSLRPAGNLNTLITDSLCCGHHLFI